MFGINFKKLGRIFTGATNDAIDAASDPGQEARQILREYQSQIAEAERSLIDVKATYEVLKNKEEEAEGEITKWTTSAKNAVNAGDDALARECLEAKRTATTQLQLIQSQIDVIGPQVNALESRIDELRAEASQMSNEVDVIQARSDISKASTKASETLAGIGNDNLSGDFKSIRERVLKDEARARVMAQQADKVGHKSLDKRVAALNASTSIDDELAALKAGN